MAIELSSGGVTKRYRYYPYDAFYVDGVQVREVWFNGVKYYPEAGDSDATCLCNLSGEQFDDDYPWDYVPYLIDPAISYYPNVTRCFSQWIIGNLPIGGRYHSKKRFCPSELVLPACTILEREAFYACRSLASIELPVCTDIGNAAFEFCSSLASIELPACREVGVYAFDACTRLASIELPVCTTLKNNAFDGCNNLRRIVLKSGTQYHGSLPSGCEIIYV